jgi:regulatory protein
MVQGTVTALRLQKRGSGRVNVYLDGVFGFGLARVLAARLRVGQELGEADVAELQRQDEEEEALGRALGLIGRRPRSVKELQQAMERRGVAQQVQEAVVARLQAQGALDDRAFADAWVENRRAFRPRSRIALRAELSRKGIDRSTTEEALAAWDDTAAALEAGRRAARRCSGLPEREFVRKVTGSLSRQGFDYETSSTVARRIWRETTLS